LRIAPNRTKGPLEFRQPVDLIDLSLAHTRMDTDPHASPKSVIERLQQAMNRHDLEAFLACIGPEYRSEQPAHPNRGFAGREQAERNWAAMFAGMPDFHAEVLATAVDGDTAWTEWHWTGSRSDGTALDMRGVTLFTIDEGRIVSGRLYMEEVEDVGGDIDATVRRLTGERGPES
jgi:ketosteroid isomerase-like protein